MNVKQARRLARLFDEATPPLSIYHEAGEPVPTVHITTRYEGGSDLGLHMLCPETTLVRFNQNLYIDEAGVLNEYDEDHDKLVPSYTTWDYRAERYTWVMVVKPLSTAGLAVVQEDLDAALRSPAYGVRS